jgi:metallo-beta-lactamase class B
MKFSAAMVTALLSSMLAVQGFAQDAAQSENTGRPGRLDLLTLEQKVANGQSFHTHQSEAVEPFRILGNIYYVGASNLASYLITSPQGHFLLDTGVQGMTDDIKRNVEALGFRMSDIKIILSSHAHFDHIQGHAIMQRMTGAQVFALEADADALEAGKDLSPLGFEGWEPVKVDRRLQDSEAIHLGEVTLTPIWAPGHSPGCTTWSMDTQDSAETLRVVFFGCNGPNDGVQLINNPRFPTLVEDALFGFDNMAKLHADIYLTGHPQAPFEGIEHLMRVQVRPHPLLNQQPWADFIAARKQDFEARVQAERDSLRQ